MQVLLATPEHLEGIVAIDGVIGSARRRVIAEAAIRDQMAWVALDGQTTAGFLLAHRHFFAHPFINLLVVKSSHRGQGIATALIRSAELAFAPGKLFTSTNQSNLPMQRLCDKLGYIRSGIVENLDADDPELIYFKQLK